MQSQLPKAEEIELYIKDIGELEKRKIMNNSLIYNFVDIVKKLKNSLRFRKKSNENVKVVKINVDNAQDLAMKYQVMSIPTLVVIKEGKEINRSVGLRDKSEIINMIK